MNDSQLILTIVAAIGLGTPLIFATVGEIITERAGILNLGVQGTMLVGAVTGFWATFQTGSLTLGILASLLAGAAFSVIHAFASITLRVSQIVSGLALTIFGTGLASFLGKAGSDPLVGEPARDQFDAIISGGIADWPVVGPLIFGHDILVYVAWIAAGAASYYLFRTRMGLSLRAVGEDPASAESAGVNVAWVRYVHVMAGGALAGLGGAYYPLALVPTWQDNPIGAAGWIAIALVILASWRPWRALFAAYLFGAAARIQFTLQTLGEPWSSIPATILAMIPFVLAIIAMIALTSGKRARFLGAPAALGIPYFREQR
ncbi:MAG: ABC transporter permease [Acidimicrobiia bacterium]|nr:ABC transporter permease [Acidimicrobiia bacterium]NND14248.1 ABC transporter permease [Acidimicrobiia bacterium]NNL27757.1 ABC transporter permease [Acidimicrobiia bacterium]